MTSPVAQMVALTCFANARLAGREIGTFFPTNSTCQFCEQVVFREPTGSFRAVANGREVAATPDEWFSSLAERRATGVRLAWRSRPLASWLPDRMGAGLVGGGGLWRMEVTYARGRRETWWSRWVVWNQQAPDQRIWQVTYDGFGAGRVRPRPEADVTGPREGLLAALAQVLSFCADHDLDGFASAFRDAQRELHGEGPENPAYHHDLAPHGFLSEETRQTLNACQHAWVFGGMGSWNDLGFKGEEQRRYDAISTCLYAALVEAIQAAANTTIPMAE